MSQSEADLPGEPVLPGALPEALRAELVAFRRDLHMHPELGNQEFRTTAAIKARLEKARPRAPGLGPAARGPAYWPPGPGSSVTSVTRPRGGPCSPCAPTSTACPSRTPRATARTARP